jgi:hypothetical protein
MMPLTIHDGLAPKIKRGDQAMLTLSRRQLLHAAAAGLFAATAVAAIPAAAAGGAASKMRAAGPYEPILASVGERRVVASFAPEFGRCKVNASVWDSVGAQADSSVRILVRLNPGQAIHIDSLEAKTESLHLRCGDDAKTLPQGDPD